MSKKKVFVISHSHWDREWYLPFENHHMRVVDLMDSVLDVIDNDPEFNSFHLDGQAVILEDYLDVRPENEARLRKAIDSGKLRIGPFYMLQDDFLTTPETHVKDFQIGKQITDRFGKRVNIGYFPDTFGNMGQTPQMMKLSNLDALAFGRGVKPTGLNNQVSDASFNSSFSEMNWEGPDKSQLLSVLFANWYSNGNDIPVDKKEAKIFWDQKLADAEKYAATPNLLMMNGVDHQPVQKNITEALNVARELYPDYEFIHSNFDDYLEALRKDLPDNLSTITGELTSQETDGWYTLTNTASSRIYLKQKGASVVDLFTNQIAPIAALNKAENYPHDQLNYAWRMILQNYIHDSITGCSIDPVHREMMNRFDKAEAVGDRLQENANKEFVSTISTSKFAEDVVPFVVFNTSGANRNETVEVVVELDQALFADGRPEVQFDKMEAKRQTLKDFQVVDENGNVYESEVIETFTRFNAEFPAEHFRVPYMGLYARVALHVEDFKPFSWKTFGLQEVESTKTESGIIVKDAETLENKFLKAKFDSATGTVEILDKKTNKTYTDFMTFEDSGDMGNEYIFKETADKLRILSKGNPLSTKVIRDNGFEGILEIKQTLMIPESAAETLDLEQRRVIDITHRQSNRSDKLVPLEITTTVTLAKNSPALKFHVSYNNEMEDHRLRVLFNTEMTTKEHEAESVFEVVKRPNGVYKTWENPTNPQRQQAFVNVHNDERGVTIGNIGLPEYEILEDGQQIAITILRSTGELGDWGYFPTPEAQTKGEQHADFSVQFHDETEVDRIQTYQLARAFVTPMMVQQTTNHEGDKPVAGEMISVKATDNAFAVTGIELDEHKQVIVRGYNMTSHNLDLEVKVLGHKLDQAVNFFGEAYDVATTKVGPAQIINLAFK